MLEALHPGAGFVGRKAKDASSSKCVVLTVEIDAGVVAPMMEDTPHVRVDPANIESVVQDFVYRPRRRDGIVITVMRNVEQKECLGEAVEQVDAHKLPGIRIESAERNPAARKHGEAQGDLDPHCPVGFGGKILVGKEAVQATA